MRCPSDTDLSVCGIKFREQILKTPYSPGKYKLFYVMGNVFLTQTRRETQEKLKSRTFFLVDF